jgi:hypothetical protein
MENKFIALTALIAIVILFAMGAAINENCVSVGQCKQCWKTTQVVVSDQLLCSGNSSCLASPADQQNNAIVDAVICACINAKSSDYGDAALNSRIEDVIKEYMKYDITAQEICEQSGTFLTKNVYG